MDEWEKKFPSPDEARAYLKERGDLYLFGVEGRHDPYWVYNYQTFKGQRFHVDLYYDGRVKVRRATGWHL